MPANVPEIVPAEEFNDLVGWLLQQRIPAAGTATAALNSVGEFPASVWTNPPEACYTAIIVLAFSPERTRSMDKHRG